MVQLLCDAHLMRTFCISILISEVGKSKFVLAIVHSLKPEIHSWVGSFYALLFLSSCSFIVGHIFDGLFDLEVGNRRCCETYNMISLGQMLCFRGFLISCEAFLVMNHEKISNTLLF